MGYFVFALAMILAAGGGGALFVSIDLLPTEIGILYAVCGVITLSAAAIVASIGAVVVRMNQLGLRGRALSVDDHPIAAAPSSSNKPSAAFAKQDYPPDEPAKNEENLAEQHPVIEDLEDKIAKPESPALPVGRYSAGGATYMIFSDGAIEAETDEGKFRFASMGDFRTYLASRRD